MAGSMSDYAEKATLDHAFGKSTWGAVVPYLALCTGDPTDAGTGSSMSECTGTDYARIAITANMAVAATPGGTITNSGALTFVAAGHATDWGTLTHFAVCDAITAGNMIYHGDLGVSKTPGLGDVVEFAIGDLDVSQT